MKLPELTKETGFNLFPFPAAWANPALPTAPDGWTVIIESNWTDWKSRPLEIVFGSIESTWPTNPANGVFGMVESKIEWYSKDSQIGAAIVDVGYGYGTQLLVRNDDSGAPLGGIAGGRVALNATRVKVMARFKTGGYANFNPYAGASMGIPPADTKLKVTASVVPAGAGAKMGNRKAYYTDWREIAAGGNHVFYPAPYSGRVALVAYEPGIFLPGALGNLYTRFTVPNGFLTNTTWAIGSQPEMMPAIPGIPLRVDNPNGVIINVGVIWELTL